MLTFVIPVDGSIELQEQQYLKVKKGSNINLAFAFYKDKLRAEAWDLTDAVTIFHAKSDLQLNSYDIEKHNASTDWDKTHVSNGILGLVLDAIDLKTAKSLFCEVKFQPPGSLRVYKTTTFLVDIVEDVET